MRLRLRKLGCASLWPFVDAAIMNRFNLSPKTILFAFLVFCVCSSKNIIIYNEETLVALSFLLFVLFVWNYFGNTVKDSLDERGEGIRIECQNFLHYKEESLQQLSAEHRKIGHLEGALQQLLLHTKECMARCTATGTQSLESTFSQQIKQKCAELSASTLSQRLQDLMAKNQEGLVLVHCRGVDNLSPSVLVNAIQLVKSTVSRA